MPRGGLSARRLDLDASSFRQGAGTGRIAAEVMQITIKIPEPLSGQSTDELATRARLLLVIDEVRAGRLTRPGAARALEMTLDDFLIQAGRHGLYAIDYDVEDFKRELDAIPKERS